MITAVNILAVIACLFAVRFLVWPLMYRLLRPIRQYRAYKAARNLGMGTTAAELLAAFVE